MELEPGSRLGPYEILSPLGAGGMGAVYLALDHKLSRKVALKVLLDEYVANPESLERFEREARAASALNHPNIITIHDVGEQDGVPFIAMEHVEGKTLDELLDAGPLTAEEVLLFATQIAEGLAKAHSAGILHRDLKPGNVMITIDGFVKILDFGLAKLAAPRAEMGSEVATIARESTRPGVVMGTASYMSPEQASGHPVDFRSDQFSLGSILYEMTTGKRAFRGNSAVQTMTAIIEKEPEPILELNPAVPEPLQRVIERCLAKDPDARYPSTSDLARELASLRDHPAGTIPGGATMRLPRVRSRRVRGLVLLLSGLLLLTFVWLIARGFRSRETIPATADGPHYLEVASFRNLSGDEQGGYFSEGFTEAIRTRLMTLEGVYVVPESSEIGAPLRLEGGIQKAGERLRITYRLVHREDGSQLAADVVDGRMEDIFALQDRVAADISGRLQNALGLPDVPSAPSQPTADVTAYSFYLQGRGYLRRHEVEENTDIAIGLFEQALGRDSEFALAQAGLGEAYWQKYEDTKQPAWMERALEASERALALDDGLAEAHTALGTVYRATGQYDQAAAAFRRALALDSRSDDAFRGLAAVFEAQGDLEEAEETYRRAIELRPDYWSSWSWLGAFYFRYGRYSEAVDQFQRVVELTPDNHSGYSALGGMYHLMGRFEEAEAMLQKSIEVKPTATGYTNLGTFYFFQGRYADSVPPMEKATELAPQDYFYWGNLADAYRWSPGLEDRAPQAYRRAVELAERELDVNPSDARTLGSLATYRAKLGDKSRSIARIEEALKLTPADTNLLLDAVLVYELAGERDRAFRALEDALRGGYSIEEVRRDPELAELRKDPRYRRLDDGK